MTITDEQTLALHTQIVCALVANRDVYSASRHERIVVTAWDILDSIIAVQAAKRDKPTTAQTEQAVTN